MSTSFEQTSPTSPNSNFDTNEYFDAVVERLKTQKALSQDTFVINMPFFNLSSISRESQVKELFQDISDPSMYKSLIKNIISLPDEKSPDLISKRLSAMQVMGFAQIVLYKVLPCPDENCPNRAREIATHNQYKDYEYECPFYHHDKDRRRIVLTPKIEEEFTYKANYSEDNRKCPGEKGKCSQNYFESMFHPLYYKMFRCKREYCNFSQCCPFYHCEDEKKTWDKIFSNFIRKDRISYVKDKQKYYEQSSKTPETRILRAGSDQYSNSKVSAKGNATPETPKYRNYRNKPGNNYSKTPKYQPRTSPSFKPANEWNENVNFKVQKQDKNKKKGTQSARKDSFEREPLMDFAHYCDQREAVANRAC